MINLLYLHLPKILDFFFFLYSILRNIWNLNFIQPKTLLNSKIKQSNVYKLSLEFYEIKSKFWLVHWYWVFQYLKTEKRRTRKITWGETNYMWEGKWAMGFWESKWRKMCFYRPMEWLIVPTTTDKLSNIMTENWPLY